MIRRATGGRRATPARAFASARTRVRPRRPPLRRPRRARAWGSRVRRDLRRAERAAVRVREARGVEDSVAEAGHDRAPPTTPMVAGTPRRVDLDRFRWRQAPGGWGRRHLGVRDVEAVLVAAGRPGERGVVRECGVVGQRAAAVRDFAADLRERGLFQAVWAPDSAAAARAATDHRGAACSADLAHSSDQMYAGAWAPSVIHTAHGPIAWCSQPTQPR